MLSAHRITFFKKVKAEKNLINMIYNIALGHKDFQSFTHYNQLLSITCPTANF